MGQIRRNRARKSVDPIGEVPQADPKPCAVPAEMAQAQTIPAPSPIPDFDDDPPARPRLSSPAPSPFSARDRADCLRRAQKGQTISLSPDFAVHVFARLYQAELLLRTIHEHRFACYGGCNGCGDQAKAAGDFSK